MLKEFRKNRQKYHTTILNKIENYVYRKKRYNIDFALSLAICNCDINKNLFSECIRQTDTYIVLEEKILGCIVFDAISADTAIKAAANLQIIFENKYFAKRHYVSVVSSSDYDSENGYKIINSLFDLLEYAISNNLSHEVVDTSRL